MRLDKFLADVNIGTRKEVKGLIKQGRVQVNGKLQKDAKAQVDPDADTVALDDIKLVYQTEFYYEMNKPQGVLSATRDLSEPTVLDLLEPQDYREDLFPVGRLDKDTTGLLILTNDGQLSHRLLSPKKHIDKVYQAVVAGIVDTADITRFAAGIQLTDFKTKPAKLEVLSTDTEAQRSTVEITISEGKFHQIKRMFASLEKPVLQLERRQMGNLVLDTNLEPGEYRPLSAHELAALQISGPKRA